MKIIDLFNKIANGEEVPKKIKFEKNIFEYDEEVKDYYSEELEVWLYNLPFGRIVNSNVKILEDNKKIEKIKYEERMGRLLDEAIIDKINELIDCINKEQE